METKLFERILQLVTAKEKLKDILKDIKMSETMFYREITDEQRNQLKSIRNKYVYDLDHKTIFKRFLQGDSPSDMAKEYRVSTSTICLSIDKGLDIHREEKNKVQEIEYIESNNQMVQYRDELLNFMLSPEGQQIPRNKLSEMLIELKNLNHFIISM